MRKFAFVAGAAAFVGGNILYIAAIPKQSLVMVIGGAACQWIAWVSLLAAKNNHGELWRTAKRLLGRGVY